MVRDEQIGNLFIAEPNRLPFRVPLYRFDDISIGRSATQLVRIHGKLRRISGVHARVEVQDGKVKLFDAGSKNGTYVMLNGRIIPAPQDYILAENERALLGTKKSLEAVRVWYTLYTQQAINTADTRTVFDTLETDVR